MALSHPFLFGEIMKKLILLSPLFLFGCTDGELVSQSYYDRGTVTEISDCSNGKRRSLRCRVETEKVIIRTDITNYPDGIVTVGDEIGYKIDYYEKSKRTSLCKNSWCMSYSVCYSWMPCWDN